MVYYCLREQNGPYAKYEYYPENHLESAPGIIDVNLSEESISVTLLAEEDFWVTHSIEDQNSLRESVNRDRVEAGEPELTEEEWPVATEAMRYTSYGSKAISHICRKYDEDGKLPQAGYMCWY